MSLHRWKDISVFHDQLLIDWKLTWSLFRHHHDGSVTSTSFQHSALKAFAFKLMALELPLLSTLQDVRRPDLYDANWNCCLCGLHKETWDHFWVCSGLRRLITALLDATKADMEAQLSALLDNPNTNLKLPATRSSLFGPAAPWHSLSCWSLPLVGASTPSLTFDYLIRGFIPSALTAHLSLYFIKSDISAVIHQVVSRAQFLFKDSIWSYRCTKFAEFELAHGISHINKVHPPSSSASCRSPSPPIHLSNGSRWKTWIARSLSARKPWMDFLLCINSLFI
jgi:hypothetical protein